MSTVSSKMGFHSFCQHVMRHHKKKYCEILVHGRPMDDLLFMYEHEYGEYVNADVFKAQKRIQGKRHS